MRFSKQNFFTLCLASCVVTFCISDCTFAQELRLNLINAKSGENEIAVSVPYTEVVEQTYQVTVPFTETITQQYTVNVPYTENVTQTYTVQVPYTETVTEDDGTEKEVTKMRTEERERVVPVQRMRAEERTRNVEVTKNRVEERTRAVPVTRTRMEMRTMQFPAPEATFEYVSGESISHDEIKRITTESKTILSLPPGETLNDLHRQVLNPQLIVMTQPAATPSNPETGSSEEAAERASSGN